MEEGEEDSPVSEATDSSISKEQQHVSNEDLAFSKATNSNEHMVNMQIPYDINEAQDPESWDNNFYAISLHRSMEHLALDVKHIK